MEKAWLYDVPCSASLTGHTKDSPAISMMQTWAQLCQVGIAPPVPQVGSLNDREASQEAAELGTGSGSFFSPDPAQSASFGAISSCIP